MTDAHQPDSPTAFEMFEGVLLLISGTAVGAPMLPGFLLAVPTLVAVTFVLLLPVVAVGLIIALAGAVLAVPYLLVRSVANLRMRRMTPPARRPMSPAAGM